MVRRAAVMLSVFIVAYAATATAQSCTPVSLDTPTRWGGNESIEIDQRDHPVRIVRGIATFGSDAEPASDVLVQVYKRNHADPMSRSREATDPPPIAACVTRDDGAFRFDLPTGEYELRFSMDKGMDVTYVYVVVAAGLHRSRAIAVKMVPGT